MTKTFNLKKNRKRGPKMKNTTKKQTTSDVPSEYICKEFLFPDAVIEISSHQKSQTCDSSGCWLMENHCAPTGLQRLAEQGKQKQTS